MVGFLDCSYISAFQSTYRVRYHDLSLALEKAFVSHPILQVLRPSHHSLYSLFKFTFYAVSWCVLHGPGICWPFTSAWIPILHLESLTHPPSLSISFVVGSILAPTVYKTCRSSSRGLITVASQWLEDDMICKNNMRVS